MEKQTDGIGQPVSSSNFHSLPSILLGMLLAALAVLLVGKILNTATLFEQPSELSYPATANVYAARRVQQGGVLYGDWRERPHVMTWYSPALYLPVACLGRWIRADTHGLFMIGRSISLLSMLGTTGLIICLLKYHYGSSWALSTVAGLSFFLADGIFVRFDISYRPDAPKCFLTLLGLVVLTRSDRWPYLFGSIVLFLMAFMYKQSSIDGPVAAASWLWLRGSRRQSLTYGVLIAVLFVGISLSLNAVTHGLYFLNTVTALKGNTTLFNIPHLLSRVAEVAVFPLTVAVFGAIVDCTRRNWDLISVAFAASLPITIAQTYRDGSNVYYYMPVLALACLLCGRQMGRWWRDRMNAGVAPVLSLTMVLALVRYVPEAATGLATLPKRWDSFTQRGEAHQRRAENLRRLADYLNGFSGPVLCQINEMGLYCPRSILIDTYTLTSMADFGVFDDKPLIEEIRRGDLAAIVLNPQLAAATWQSTDMLSRRWREAMSQRYHRVRVPGLEWAEIYRPMHPSPTGAEEASKAVEQRPHQNGPSRR